MLKRPYRRAIYLGGGPKKSVCEDLKCGKLAWDDSMSDGCGTGWLNILIPEGKHLPCCIEHDKHYVLHDVTRREADRKLFYCLLVHGFSKTRASVWYFGVRLAGWLPWYT